MTMMAEHTGLANDQLEEYEKDGFTVARGLFSPAEVEETKLFFDRLAEEGKPIPGSWEPKDGSDPLSKYPRVIHPHLFDEGSRRRLIDPRLRVILRQLLRDEPLAVQTMYYFKPPGARGQAFHQDNYFLRIKPASCIAAWTAIDGATPDNGGLQLCPGTQNFEVVCPEIADSAESFTRDLVRPPEGHEPIKLVLEPGDTLFFNGSVVHGSQSNRTVNQWRRSFIAHYMPAQASHIGKWYLPAILDFEGRGLSKESNEDGGPCGDEFTEERQVLH